VKVKKEIPIGRTIFKKAIGCKPKLILKALAFSIKKLKYLI